MAGEFSINVNTIESLASELSSAAGGLRSDARSLAGVCSLLNGGEFDSVKQSIRTISSQLDEEAERVQKFGTRLRTAANTYQRYDREVAGQSSGSHDILSAAAGVAFGASSAGGGGGFRGSEGHSGRGHSGGGGGGGGRGASANENGHIEKDKSKVTAYIGKASAEAKGEHAKGEVHAYIGKAEGELKSDFSFGKKQKKSEYKDGEWKETDKDTFMNMEVAAGVSASALSADAKGEVGDDMLGLEGKAEADIGKAELKGKGQFSVGEDGVNAYAEGSAIVTAAEGKAEGTINILGFEITGTAKGYAGAAGVEGKAGVKDGKFVLEGGAAALIGGAVGIEIGLNEGAKDFYTKDLPKFVDFLTFWD